jgi:hypothetical protein
MYWPLNLYSEGARFEFRPAHRQTVSSIPQKNVETGQSSGHDHILSNPYPLIIYQ